LFPIALPAVARAVPARQYPLAALAHGHAASAVWIGALIWLLPLLLVIALYVFFSRRTAGLPQGRQEHRIFGLGQSKARLYSEERPSTTLADVAGVKAAKRELQEEVDYLRDPKKYQRLGARIPKGMLLVVECNQPLQA
jgi:cell division protease FtsH